MPPRGGSRKPTKRPPRTQKVQRQRTRTLRGSRRMKVETPRNVEEKFEEEEEKKQKQETWLDHLPPVIKLDEELHQRLSKERREKRKEKVLEYCHRELLGILNLTFTLMQSSEEDKEKPERMREWHVMQLHKEYRMGKFTPDKESAEIKVERKQCSILVEPKFTLEISKYLRFSSDSIWNDLSAFFKCELNDNIIHDPDPKMDELLTYLQKQMKIFQQPYHPFDKLDFPFIVCVVGPQGSGRTTVTQLLQKIYDINIIEVVPASQADILIRKKRNQNLDVSDIPQTPEYPLQNGIIIKSYDDNSTSVAIAQAIRDLYLNAPASSNFNSTSTSNSNSVIIEGDASQTPTNPTTPSSQSKLNSANNSNKNSNASIVSKNSARSNSNTATPKASTRVPRPSQAPTPIFTLNPVPSPLSTSPNSNLTSLSNLLQNKKGIVIIGWPNSKPQLTQLEKEINKILNPAPSSRPVSRTSASDSASRTKAQNFNINGIIFTLNPNQSRDRLLDPVTGNVYQENFYMPGFLDFYDVLPTEFGKQKEEIHSRLINHIAPEYPAITPKVIARYNMFENGIKKLYLTTAVPHCDSIKQIFQLLDSFIETLYKKLGRDLFPPNPLAILSHPYHLAKPGLCYNAIQSWRECLNRFGPIIADQSCLISILGSRLDQMVSEAEERFALFISVKDPRGEKCEEFEKEYFKNVSLPNTNYPTDVNSLQVNGRSKTSNGNRGIKTPILKGVKYPNNSSLSSSRRVKTPIEKNRLNTMIANIVTPTKPPFDLTTKLPIRYDTIRNPKSSLINNKNNSTVAFQSAPVPITPKFDESNEHTDFFKLIWDLSLESRDKALTYVDEVVDNSGLRELVLELKKTPKLIFIALLTRLYYSKWFYQKFAYLLDRNDRNRNNDFGSNFNLSNILEIVNSNYTPPPNVVIPTGTNTTKSSPANGRSISRNLASDLTTSPRDKNSLNNESPFIINGKKCNFISTCLIDREIPPEVDILPERKIIIKQNNSFLSNNVDNTINIENFDRIPSINYSLSGNIENLNERQMNFKKSKLNKIKLIKKSNLRHQTNQKNECFFDIDKVLYDFKAPSFEQQKEVDDDEIIEFSDKFFNHLLNNMDDKRLMSNVKSSLSLFNSFSDMIKQQEALLFDSLQKLKYEISEYAYNKCSVEMEYFTRMFRRFKMDKNQNSLPNSNPIYNNEDKQISEAVYDDFGSINGKLFEYDFSKLRKDLLPLARFAITQDPPLIAQKMVSFQTVLKIAQYFKSKNQVYCNIQTFLDALHIIDASEEEKIGFELCIRILVCNECFSIPKVLLCFIHYPEEGKIITDLFSDLSDN